MRASSATALVLGAVALSAAIARAQDAPPVLTPDAPLTLRPVDGMAPLANDVARSLALRLDVAVDVGEAPPPEILEAIPTGHISLTRADGMVLLVLAGPEGQIFRSEVAIGEEDGRGAARAVALAIEALRDAAMEGPPQGTATRRTYEHEGHEVTWIYREREGGLFGPRPRLEADAKPLIQLGLLGGLSTQRLSFFVAPRIGLGLCLHDTCLVLEGDVVVNQEEHSACDGRRLVYRPATLGLRLSVRPVNVDDTLFMAFGVGILSRFGVASLVGVDVSRVTTDFGVRAGVDLAWRFAAPLELALEVGTDVQVTPARFVRAPRPPPGVVCPLIESIFVEDLVTVWAALVVRLRP